MHIRMYVCMYVCVYVCVRTRIYIHIYIYTHTNIHMYTYIYIYIHIYIYICCGPPSRSHESGPGADPHLTSHCPKKHRCTRLDPSAARTPPSAGHRVGRPVPRHVQGAAPPPHGPPCSTRADQVTSCLIKVARPSPCAQGAHRARMGGTHEDVLVLIYW